MVWRRWFERATRSLLGLSPSHDELASALLNLPPKAARARVTSLAVTALKAERERVASKSKGTLGTTNASCSHDVTYVLPPAEVRASQIPGAGSGLFMRRDTAANPGDLIALYAGNYTPPAPPITPGCDGTSIIIPEPKLGDEGRADRPTPNHFTRRPFCFFFFLFSVYTHRVLRLRVPSPRRPWA